MVDFVHLQGSEEVGRAGSNIRQAADEMERAARSISSSVEQLGRMLEEHAQRIEAAMAPKPAPLTLGGPPYVVTASAPIGPGRTLPPLLCPCKDKSPEEREQCRNWIPF